MVEMIIDPENENISSTMDYVAPSLRKLGLVDVHGPIVYSSLGEPS